MGSALVLTPLTFRRVWAALRSVPAPRRCGSPPSASCRFELSEEDRALFEDVREAVSHQGEQSQEQHASLLVVFAQMESRLKMEVSDMRRELQANLGDEAVDLDAKEQKYLDQIVIMLAQLEAAARSSPAGAGRCFALTAADVSSTSTFLRLARAAHLRRSPDGSS